MNKRRHILKTLHLAGTVWFLLCAAYLLMITTWQTGTGWQNILPLPGYSVFIIFAMVCIYLFAVFRNITATRKQEHPLTSSNQYALLYNISPFLGPIAVVIVATSVSLQTPIVFIALATLATTFLMWMAIDPLISSVEMLLPQSRIHRRQRINKYRNKCRFNKLKRQNMITRIHQQHELQLQSWQQILNDWSDLLCRTLEDDQLDPDQKRTRVTNIGLDAWKLGGIECMRRLYQLTQIKHPYLADQTEKISFWWDGIGKWSVTTL